MGLEFTVFSKKLVFLVSLFFAVIIIAGTAFAQDYPDVGHDPNQLNLTPIYIDTVNMRVGIGIQAPTETLDIDGGIKATGSIEVDSITATGTICDVNGCIGAGGASLWTQSGSDIYYNTAGGNVGIGTTNPTEKLEVIGNIQVDATSDICIAGGNCLSSVAAGGDTDWTESGGNVYRLIGNVGIGISSPGTELVVNDDTGNSVINVSSPAGQWSAIDFSAGASNLWGIGKNNLGNFYIDESGIDIRRFTILPGGNVGIGTNNPEFKLTLGMDEATPDGGILSVGTWNWGNTLTTSGSGVRLIWYPRKAAFRAGEVIDDRWDDNNIGVYSFAIGNNPLASGGGGIAMGYFAEAIGSNGVAIGRLTEASGSNSIAIGSGATASGYESVAMGANTEASGMYSTTMGQGTEASGTRSTAMGRFTTASGDYSTAIGHGIEAQGEYSVAIALNDQSGTVVIQDNTMAIMGGDVGIGTTNPQDITSDSDLTIAGTIAQDPWIAPTLGGGWTNYDVLPDYNPAGYFRDKNGIVHLRGMLDSTSAATNVIFSLPAGYRPDHNEVHVIQAYSGGAYATRELYVNAVTGSVRVYGGPPVIPTDWASIDGVTFRAVGY